MCENIFKKLSQKLAQLQKTVYLCVIINTSIITNNMSVLLPAAIHDSVLGQLVQLKKAINYHNENFEPHYNDMEEWERKEYQSCQENRVNEYNHQLEYVKANEGVFNSLLLVAKMQMSVAVFIVKYA